MVDNGNSDRKDVHKGIGYVPADFYTSRNIRDYFREQGFEVKLTSKDIIKTCDCLHLISSDSEKYAHIKRSLLKEVGYTHILQDEKKVALADASYGAVHGALVGLYNSIKDDQNRFR